VIKLNWVKEDYRKKFSALCTAAERHFYRFKPTDSSPIRESGDNRGFD